MTLYQVRNTTTGEMKAAGLWKWSKRGGKVWTTKAAFHNMLAMHCEVYRRTPLKAFDDWEIIVMNNGGREREIFTAANYEYFTNKYNGKSLD